MTIFILLIVLSVAGIAFVIFTMKKEEPCDESEIAEISPEQVETTNKSSLLNFLSFGKKKEDIVEPLSLTEDSLEDSDIGTASLMTSPVEELSQSEKIIEEIVQEEVALPEDNTEEKKTKLEELLKEKNAALEELQKALNKEQENRESFDKVKEILQKELIDTREKARKAKKELSLTSDEGDQYAEQIDELQEKANNLERNLEDKDKDIEELTRRLEQNKHKQEAEKEGLKIVYEEPMKTEDNIIVSEKVEEIKQEDLPEVTVVTESEEPDIDLTKHNEIEIINTDEVSEDIASKEKNIVEQATSVEDDKKDPVIEITDTDLKEASEEDNTKEDEQEEESEEEQNPGFLKLKPDILKEEDKE
ncbi:MAG: hypothetical protein P9X22_01805 [Candidatus Zapsychrus exili]|nr:hypothetical protein [Candidatus Zapsychrus exili]